MKKKYRLILTMVVCLCLMMTLLGCKAGRELNELSIVVGIGLDKTEVPDQILLTAQVVKPGDIKKSSKDGDGNGSKPFWNIKIAANTVFDAVRKLTHESSNKLYTSHSQVIIVGSELALIGVQKHLDFFMRSTESRPTTLILVSEGKASEVLDVNPEINTLPAQNIAKLAKSQGFTSQSKAVNLQEFTTRLLSKTTAPLAPLVKMIGEGKEKTVALSGMAVFKNDKLVGTLDTTETRGLLWVAGKIESGSIEVTVPNGKAVIEIKGATSKIIPTIKEGKVYIDITITEEGVLIEQTSPENLATISGFSLIEKGQAEVIRKEIIASLEKAKALHTDYFGFGDEIHHKYSAEWTYMKNNWDEIFPSIEMNIKIDSTITSSNLTLKPAVPESGE